jgi:ABC-type branched-subunit amino acid transport system substrate-binding protein
MMMGPRSKLAGAGLALLLAVGVTACGKSSPTNGGGGAGSQQSGGIKTGPGVTATTITLGVLTDESGVFAGLGTPLTQAEQLFWAHQNRAGGICNRQVKLDIGDHGYDVQKAVSLYRDMSPNILALQQLLGSPVTAALLPSIQQDTLYTEIAGWPGGLLNNPYAQITGASYDVEAINAIDWLVKTGKLKRGDSVGELYFQGDYGQNALAGVQYAASKDGLKVVGQEITPADTDMTAQVAVFKRAGVEAIIGSEAPPQTASLAGVAAASGLSVPIVVDGPGFDPHLLGTAAAGALKANVYVSTSLASPSLSVPAVQRVTKLWTAAYPKEPPAAVSVIFGWAQAKIMKDVLLKACANKDLTRQGLLTAFRQLSNVDTGGLVAGSLSYTTQGAPPTRAVYIARVDPSAAGGTRSLGVFDSSNANSYTEGH